MVANAMIGLASATFRRFIGLSAQHFCRSSILTDRPIVFSAAMVSALLAGRKSQTRRLSLSPLRRVEVGDRLWVRETYSATFWTPDNVDGVPREFWATPKAERTEQFKSQCYYRVDEEEKRPGFVPAGQWSSSLHMPRWASRLTLIVTEIRVQRLQEITGSDAEAEGVVYEMADPPSYYVPGIMPHSLTSVEVNEGPAASYAKLWNRLHTEPRTQWAGNPEIVALSFTVARGNIDAQAVTSTGSSLLRSSNAQAAFT